MIIKVVVSHNEYKAGEVRRVVGWDPWTKAKLRSGYFKLVQEEADDVENPPVPVSGPENETGRRKVRRKRNVAAGPVRVEEDGPTESGAPVGVEEAETGSTPE